MSEYSLELCQQNPDLAVREIARLQQRVVDLEEALERLREGKEVVVPKDGKHAVYMMSIGQAHVHHELDEL